MTAKTTDYATVRVSYDSSLDFEATRARFEALVPEFASAVSAQLVIDNASWPEVQAAVDGRVGPAGLVTLARLDQGALFSLSGEPVDATLYLVGNPVLARQLVSLETAAALYAPFRAAIYRDASGVHLAYDKPSSVFASLGSATIDASAVELDDKIRIAAEESIR